MHFSTSNHVTKFTMPLQGHIATAGTLEKLESLLPWNVPLKRMK
jgi:hypothetical protein